MGGGHLSCTGTLGNEYKVFISKHARKETLASLNGLGLGVRKRGCDASASLGASLICFASSVLNECRMRNYI